MKSLEGQLTTEIKGHVNTKKTDIAGSNAAIVSLVPHHAGLPAADPSTPFKATWELTTPHEGK